jgi:hypothetical protein
MHATWKAILNWPARLALLAAAAATTGPAPAGPAVTPSGPAVPENLLRIGLHFAQPLSAPLDVRHVALINSDGQPIPDAFLDLAPADADGLGVSLLLHPGRIKTGVGPNLALGPALRAGQMVTLRIDDPQLPAPLEKRWQVGPALRKPLSPQHWRVYAVKPGSRQELRVAFNQALDGDAAALIAVQSQDGRRLTGTARLSAGESEWRFIPSAPWKAGGYVLRVHPRLEDTQGNRLCSAFEQLEQSARACNEEGRRPFTVGK